MCYEPHTYAPHHHPSPPLPRSLDTKHAVRVVQDIKMLRSAVVLRDKERAERATLVTQEKLVLCGCCLATCRERKGRG